jgi:hypothetical protein
MLNGKEIGKVTRKQIGYTFSKDCISNFDFDLFPCYHMLCGALLGCRAAARSHSF